MRRALLLLLVGLGASARADLFSPGELSKQHRALEGLSQCTRCHPAGGQLSQETCLACHQELQPRLGKGLGFHGRLAPDKRACESCHHEHQGQAVPITDYGPGGEKGFNHQRTGWPLKGKHQEQKCTGCHEKRRILWPTALKLLDARPHTRLGLGTACTDCHFDEHRGQQQEDCEFCHDERGWKPPVGFNHDDSGYPLKGKHAQVKCTGCHPTEHDPEARGFPAPESETFLRFKPLEHRSCLDCHKDPHDGRFGLRCQSCHVVEGWRIVRSSSGERAFHEKTRFPLKGAHADVGCAACHGPWPGVRAKFKGLAFQRCDTCHVDAHEGQLATHGKAPDCDACHSEQGFAPAKYALADHARSRYPLEGAHEAVPCRACHEESAALKARIPKVVLAELRKKKLQALFSEVRFDFAKPLERCDSCHDDAHQAQFKGTACDACHRVESFRKLGFDHQRDSRYPLEGAHRDVKCEKCHWAPGPKAVVKYKPLETACRACHLDVHAGQFAARGAPAKCEACHELAGWKRLKFVHEAPFTTFLLEGKHASTQCERCHHPVTLAEGVKATQYRGLPRSCEGCHADFHEGAFKGFEP